jgi:hypothetical protein
MSHDVLGRAGRAAHLVTDVEQGDGAEKVIEFGG